MIIFHKIRRVFSAFYSEFPFFALGSDFTLCPAWFSDISVARAPRPIVRLHRTASFAVTPQLSLRRPTFSALPEKVGKKMRWMRFILRADVRDFLAAPRPERPDGRKTVTILIAFGSGKCTTRICGQTASISVLLISGILGRLRYCTACCRHRPLQRFTMERNDSAPSAHT